MRLAIAIITCVATALAGCSSSRSDGSSDAAPSASTSLAPPELDEAGVRSKSRAFVDAYDRLDVPAVQAQLGASFAELSSGWLYDRATFLKSLEARKAGAPPPSKSRTCKSERVFIGQGTATLVAECVLRLTFDGGAPIAFDGWSTLVWVREGSEWKVAHWQWQKAGIDADRDQWNGEYRRAVSFNHAPNKLLVDTVKGRAPGAALDLMMGQGRNAVFLATQGWKVTGVDISDTGIRIARDDAAAKHVTIDAIDADVETWDLGRDRWDLVTMIYAGTDHALIERIQASLKTGGIIVVEVFHKASTLGVGSGGFDTGELAALFADGFTILRDEVAEDRADWGLEKVKLVRFVAQKK